MSVNFYAVTPDHTPSDTEPGLHIGQSTATSRFLLRSHEEPDLKSWAAWTKFLQRPDVTIVSESGYTLTFQELADDVMRRHDSQGMFMTPRHVHRPKHGPEYFADAQGFEFCRVAFH
ncbi:hypothetical protein [Streptomyces sp. NPDC056056]|uniref:hypothetical protein n=1 Tax=Streptomyces sp. NPDC056056 TaxID=3345698 RepID=UPI0035E2AA43